MGRIWGGVLLLLFSLFMLVGFLQADLPANPAARLVFFILIVLAPAVGGGMLLRSWFIRRRTLYKRKELLRQQTLQAEILKLAAHRGGSLNAQDVVAAIGVPAEEAAAALDSLAVKGSVEVDISEVGVLIYRFSEAQLPSENRSVGNAGGR
jgi:hypothetical protein